DRLQSGRGADDLFEHGDPIDLFSQRHVLLPRLFLRLFAIIDVGAGGIPANDRSSFVPHRVVLDEEPTILPVPAAHASFIFEWDPSRDRRGAYLAQSLGILRMKHITETFRRHFFFR